MHKYKNYLADNKASDVMINLQVALLREASLLP